MQPKIEVVARPSQDDPQQHVVMLTIGPQQFLVGSGPGFENEEQAQGFADLLAHALAQLHAPALRPIRSENDHAAALQEIDRLIGLSPAPESPAGERLDVLVTLVEAYERETVSFAPPSAIAAIEFRMEQGGHAREDLERLLGGRERAGAVMSGASELTRVEAWRLHSEWGIPIGPLVGRGVEPGMTLVAQDPGCLSFKLDPESLPKLTPEEAAALDAAPIDYSDIPQTPPGFWDRHRPARVENKTLITLRLDSEVVDFFKKAGKRYQTRINGVLRAFVEHEAREKRA